MVTQEEPVTAHQSWSWFHANPASLREGDGRLRVLRAGCSPRGQLPMEKHSLCQLGDFPSLPGCLERVAWSHGGQKVPNSQLQSKLHLGTAAVLRGNRAGAWDWCLELQSQAQSCSHQRLTVENIPIPHFLLRITLWSRLFLLNFWMFSLTQGFLPGETLTYHKSWRSQGLVKKHSLIFHNSKKV